MQLFPPPRIESPRAYARRCTAADADALFQSITGDAEVMLHLPIRQHESAEQTRKFLEASEKGWDAGIIHRWSLVESGTGEIFGILELIPILPRVEIGVMLASRRSHLHRRALARILRALIGWLDKEPSVYRIFACCAVDGLSASVMPKLGFELEATMRNYEARPNQGLVAGDSYLFARVRSGPTEESAQSLTPASNDWLVDEIVW